MISLYGIEYIHKYIERLEKNHIQHISVYGENNHLRLKHIQSRINKLLKSKQLKAVKD